MKISKAIRFKTGSAELLPESDNALKVIKQYLDSKAYISLLRVEGHVFNQTNNQQLSEQRAMAICNKLIVLGVDCQRLLAVGFGDTKPLMQNDTPEGKETNNRICLVNAKLNGKTIGGMSVDGGGKIVVSSLCN